MSWRKYEKLIDNIKPDLEEYEAMKANLSDDDVYRDADSLAYTSSDTNKPSAAQMNRMVMDLNKQ
jgi:hypothetical protein